MTRDEQVLYLSFLRCAKRYFEFGSGGSTYAAAQTVQGSIISVDSSAAWLQRVKEACGAPSARTMPQLLHVDIGEVADWGFPKDEQRRADWPAYHTKVWELPGSTKADYYLVDGRFRVACFLQVVARAERAVPIAIHDFADRPHYHVVFQFADEIARAERMSIFKRKRRLEPDSLQLALDEYRFDPK